MDERGSAYAWLLFFIAAWVFSMIFYFFLYPMWELTLKTAEINGFVSVEGASTLYSFWASIYTYIPLLALLFLTIALLKYASSVRRGPL